MQMLRAQTTEGKLKKNFFRFITPIKLHNVLGLLLGDLHSLCLLLLLCFRTCLEDEKGWKYCGEKEQMECLLLKAISPIYLGAEQSRAALGGRSLLSAAQAGRRVVCDGESHGI